MSEDIVSSDDSIDKGRYLMIMMMMIEIMMMIDDGNMMTMSMSILSINHNSYYVNVTYYRMDF